MSVILLESYTSRVTHHMVDLLLDAAGGGIGIRPPAGLPAGARYREDIGLILAGTCCDAPLYQDTILAVADRAGADVVLAHHGRFPEILNPVQFSIAARVNGKARLLSNMLLYVERSRGTWLIPSASGPFVSLSGAGLHIRFTPPFMTYVQRQDGLCAAAARIVRAMRGKGAR